MVSIASDRQSCGGRPKRRGVPTHHAAEGVFSLQDLEHNQPDDAYDQLGPTLRRGGGYGLQVAYIHDGELQGDEEDQLPTLSDRTLCRAGAMDTRAAFLPALEGETNLEARSHSSNAYIQGIASGTPTTPTMQEVSVSSASGVSCCAKNGGSRPLQIALMVLTRTDEVSVRVHALEHGG
jgi:hypothetical protein